MEFSFWAKVSALVDNIANPYLDSRADKEATFSQKPLKYLETVDGWIKKLIKWSFRGWKRDCQLGYYPLLFLEKWNSHPVFFFFNNSPSTSQQKLMQPDYFYYSQQAELLRSFARNSFAPNVQINHRMTLESLNFTSDEKWSHLWNSWG